MSKYPPGEHQKTNTYLESGPRGYKQHVNKTHLRKTTPKSSEFITQKLTFSANVQQATFKRNIA